MAALTLSAAIADAYITPGPHRPPGHGHGPGHGPGRGPGYPPGYPPGDNGYGNITVPVYVDGNYYSSDRIDLGRYVDLYHYRGYRLVAIDFTAAANYNSALLDVLINGFQVAPTINLNPYPNNFRIFPNQHFVIGYGADSIVLMTRGDLNLRLVFLQLSR